MTFKEKKREILREKREKLITTPSETSYLDTTINIGEENGTVSISVYDKREDFNLKIVNFPYLDRNIPRNPAYGVYISQLHRRQVWAVAAWSVELVHQVVGAVLLGLLGPGAMYGPSGGRCGLARLAWSRNVRRLTRSPKILRGFPITECRLMHSSGLFWKCL